MASTNSSASSSARSTSRRHSLHGASLGPEDSVPVETLVRHLLDAKRSLSSMRLVLRANDLVHLARQAHEESVILSAQSQFLRRGISDQVRLLLRVRRSMNKTYDKGKREFKQVIKDLDATNSRLEDTMNVLRSRTVDSAFRPEGEEKKNLLDFIDEQQVHNIRNTLKENITALQDTQTSFDGDLLRFDTDLRALNKSMASVPSIRSPSASSDDPPPSHLLNSMIEHSHAMAELLTSLTKHFDLCVTAVRTTEGGTALARIKAAEVTALSQGGISSNEDVSISGVIAEQESHMPELEPLSGADRAQMLEVVVQDASEVDDVVQELNERLQSMEEGDFGFARLDALARRARRDHGDALAGFRALEDVGSRVRSYIAAEAEFRQRWQAEHEAIRAAMAEMDGLRLFYESYAGSYDGLILEAERRRALEDKVRAVWRKARESVDRLVDADRRERDAFRHEVGEFLPTDLWPGLDDAMCRWEVVPVREGPSSKGGKAAAAAGGAVLPHDGRGDGGSGSTPALERSVVQAAAMRRGRR